MGLEIEESTNLFPPREISRRDEHPSSHPPPKTFVQMKGELFFSFVRGAAACRALLVPSTPLESPFQELSLLRRNRSPTTFILISSYVGEGGGELLFVLLVSRTQDDDGCF